MTFWTLESNTFCVLGMIFSEKFGLCFSCIGTNMNKPRSSWKCMGGELTFSHLTRQAMKEILLAGDTNRLVAELTFVSWRFLAVDESKAESVKNFH